ncbi:UDP-N-acetylglucosamine 2-epimerase [bacterium]|nr:UDP-N-acetylglucosamine 2-epimerase [bacterium]
MISNNCRKICVVVASRANYARVKSVMKAIEKHPDLILQIVIGASALLERFGMAVNVIKKEGFKPDRIIYYVVEGETLSTQAKSTGLGIVELATAYEDLKPDIVLTVADRFETMATAISATYLNIPLVHLQGGEVSGNIDDRVRHAVTKLSDFHFVSTDDSLNRLIRMGEPDQRVFNYGCPAMDLLLGSNLSISEELMSGYNGIGIPIKWDKPYMLMVQHPVTTSYGEGFNQIVSTLNALSKIKNIQKVVLWPNIDAGSDDVSKGIRVFREDNIDSNFAYFKNFSPGDYAKVLNNSVCCIGNSSSFIREGSFLGVPAVLVGDRQLDREHGDNVVFAGYNTDEIYQKTLMQIERGRCEPDTLFGKGDAGQRIAEELSNLKLDRIKRNSY